MDDERRSDAPADSHLTRREVLRRGGSLAAVAFAPIGLGDSSARAVVVPLTAGGASAGFLGAEELRCLRALVDRFIPGPPEDLDPGAAEAGCAEAIDALLGAFNVSPPRIYAGAPFSDRGDAPTNDFLNFLPLDDYEELAWRLRIEGSQGRPELEFNGPVIGLQEIYRKGLAALDRAAGPGGFAACLEIHREIVLRTADDPAVAALVDVAFPHTFQFMYGAPEYGGNRNLVSWKFTKFDGDVQPRGYTREQVENVDEPGLFDLLPALPSSIPLADILALAPLASPEGAQAVHQSAQGLLSGFSASVTSLLAGRGSRRRTTDEA